MVSLLSAQILSLPSPFVMPNPTRRRGWKTAWHVKTWSRYPSRTPICYSSLISLRLRYFIHLWFRSSSHVSVHILFVVGPPTLLSFLSFILIFGSPSFLSRLSFIDAKHRLWFHVFMFHMTFTLHSHRPPLYVIASQPRSLLFFPYLFHLRDPDYFPISSRPPFSINSRLCIMVQ